MLLSFLPIRSSFNDDRFIPPDKRLKEREKSRSWAKFLWEKFLFLWKILKMDLKEELQRESNNDSSHNWKLF